VLSSAVALAVTACGASSSTAEESAGSGASTTTAVAASTVTTVASVVTTLGGASTTKDASFSGDDSKEFCALSKSTDFDGGIDFTGTADTIKKTFTVTIDGMKQLVAKAPDEIKPDVKTLLGAIVGVDAIYAKGDYDIAKVAADANSSIELEKLGAGLDEAMSRLDQYSEKVCGEKPPA
jgi:hypothetical protein